MILTSTKSPTFNCWPSSIYTRPSISGASALLRALEAYGERFIECRGFASNAEILVKAAKAGPLDCAEVAMIYRYDLKRGASNMKIADNLTEYMKLFWNVLRG